jgi:hypothetical protein
MTPLQHVAGEALSAFGVIGRDAVFCRTAVRIAAMKTGG